MRLKICTKLPDKERHYIYNLLASGTAEVPNEKGKISRNAKYKLLVKNGFIVGAERVEWKELKKK